MKKLLIAAAIALVVLIAGLVISFTPTDVEVAMPIYANADDKLGYITAFDEQNGVMFFTFDEATWEETPQGPNPARVVNDEASTTNLVLAPKAKIEIFDEQEDDGLRDVNVNELEESLTFDYDLPFWASFDDKGRVKQLKQQYVP